ncbi:hypothetical protein [Streptomyces lydicamycinicus]|uniref:hypothetical protein n=1 Tax=Streptomyces lydicamycinicus TaxID=1546107 RepID=UPI003C2F0F41
MDRTQPTPATRHTIAVGILGRRAGRTIATVRTATGTTGTVRHDSLSTQARQTRHALTALAATTPGRRAFIAQAATDYLSQVDRRRLPVGYQAPILDDRRNRADAYRMRRGDTVARMLGLAVRPDDEHLPNTARAVLAAVNATVDQLTDAAHRTGEPGAIAAVYVLTGAIPAGAAR